MSVVIAIGNKSFHTKWLMLAAFFVCSGLFGVQTLRSSSAATYSSNPAGVADYCKLVGTTTYIYGWAYDAEAPAGAQPYVQLRVTNAPALGNLPSSIAGYRDAPINAWIDTNRPGAPHTGTYGWSAQFINLYRGKTYTMSGTVLNYGAGTSVALSMNANKPVDGDASKPYFAGSAIPAACLPAAPVVTPPPTTPAPPPPTPPKPVVRAPRPPATTPTPSSDANGSAVVGTTSAIITVPAGNATSVHLLYGKEPNEATADQPTNGADTAITLKGLNAKTTYAYKIVRTLGTQTTTSESATFTTNGYTLLLKFTNNAKKPVSKIAAELNGTKLQSDDAGEVRFDDLAAGTYNPKFTYRNKAYYQDISLGAESSAEQGKTITASKTINLDQLQNTSSLSKQAPSGSKLKTGLIAVVGISVLILLAAIGWFVWKLLAARMQDRHINKPRAGRDIIDAHSTLQFNQANQPTGPQPHNVGVSLKDMVIQSMREEAAHKPQQPDPNDPNNWQPPAPGR